MYDEGFSYPDGPYRGGRGGGRRGGGWGEGARGGGWGGGGRGGHRGHRGHRGGGRGFEGGPFDGPRGYGRRGDGARIAVLTLLKEAAGPRSGAQLAQTLSGLGFGRRFPLPTLIYGTLQQLEDEGLVSAAAAETGTGRTYELTDAGTEYLDSVGTQPGFAPLNEGSAALRQAVIATIAAARQVARDGGPEGPAKAAELLNTARKGMYRLLAGDTE
jgi:DNA-binding PadR family transcriptional regulator